MFKNIKEKLVHFRNRVLETEIVKSVYQGDLKGYIEVLYESLMNFRTNQVPVRAAALTYTTLLSLIPFVIILSSFAGYFGYLDLLLEFLPEIDRNLSLNLPMDKVELVTTHIQGLKLGKLGVIGSLTLFASFLIAMSTLEKAMNIIWGIKKNRNLLIKFKIYIPFLMFLLVFIMGFVWMLLKFRVYLDHTIQGVTGASLNGVLPFGGMLLGMVPFIWLFLAILYYIIPFTHVKLWSALVSATICTVLLLLFLNFAVKFQAFLFLRYSVVYGSLAILPMVMLFFYLLWIIVLYGVGLTQSHQTRKL